MAKQETNILKSIMLAVSGHGSKLFRNNVGLFTTDTGDKVRTGLCKGSHDLIGWTPVVITRQMVGTKIAVFTSIEVKTPKGRASDGQKNWTHQVQLDGGLSDIARDDDDALQIIRGEQHLLK